MMPMSFGLASEAQSEQTRNQSKSSSAQTCPFIPRSISLVGSFMFSHWCADARICGFAEIYQDFSGLRCSPVFFLSFRF